MIDDVLQLDSLHLDHAALSLACSEDGSLIAVGAGDTVGLHDGRTLDRLVRLDAHGGLVRATAFGESGDIVATAGNDGVVCVWDTRRGTLLRALHGHEAMVVSLSFDGAGLLLASASADGTVRVWNAASGSSIRTIRGHRGPVLGVAVEPLRRSLVSGGYDGTLRVSSLATGECVTVLEGHRGWISSVDFSRDGRFIASASLDGTVRLWDARSWTCLGEIDPGAERVASLSFSPDGDNLVVGAAGSLSVFATSTLQCSRTFRAHVGDISAVVWNARGDRIASCARDGSMRLWRPPSDRIQLGSGAPPRDEITDLPMPKLQIVAS